MQLSKALKSQDVSFNGESVLQHGIKVPRKNFERYYKIAGVNKHFELLFQGRERMILTRGGVFESFGQDTDFGIVSSIVWGFPRGVLPGGRPLSDVFENLGFFKEAIEHIKKSGLNEAEFYKINSIRGVKNGITSKMLYFSGSKINEVKCLIFDSRVRDCLLDKRPVEFGSTLSCLPKNSLFPGWDGYNAFCQDVGKLATDLKISEDSIEMYLFNSAPNRRKARHAEVD